VTDRPVVLGVAPWTGAAAVELAFAEAAARGAALQAVRVWDDPAVDLGRPRPDRIAAWDEVHRRARAELERALAAPRAAHPEVPVELVVAQDRAVELLAALTAHAQLLVLGRPRRTAGDGGPAGSPVDALLRTAACPVLVVPATARAEHGARA
jgi:nucleotide-binding universal stress UspA family protein